MTRQRKELEAIPMRYPQMERTDGRAGVQIMAGTRGNRRDSGNLSQRRRKAQQRKKRRRAFKILVTTALLAAFICLGVPRIFPLAGELIEKIDLENQIQGQSLIRNQGQEQEQGQGKTQDQEALSSNKQMGVKSQDYPPELAELLEKNEETLDFVEDYANRSNYIGEEINLDKEVEPGEVPLLLQWDKRWGYNDYGQEMIGLAGCGPTCLSMAYIYLTGDTSMNPRKMSKFSYDNGFYTTEGTSWSLWTDGASEVGLQGYEISLDEDVIKKHLDRGELVVCSMAPGDFTTTGHFILLRGYDEKGFFVNDPNSRRNSEKQWDFKTLQYQIKCLWALGN